MLQLTPTLQVIEDDPDMAEEADFKAQEEAEELKRQRIEGASLCSIAHSTCPDCPHPQSSDSRPPKR